MLEARRQGKARYDPRANAERDEVAQIQNNTKDCGNNNNETTSPVNAESRGTTRRIVVSAKPHPLVEGKNQSCGKSVTNKEGHRSGKEEGETVSVLIRRLEIARSIKASNPGASLEFF